METVFMFDLTGKKAIVTGAGQGLGEQMALGLAEAGADVAVVDINLDEASRVTGKIRSLGRKSISVKVDVSKINEVRKMVRMVKDEFNRIDIIINNAGISHHAPAEEMTEENWNRVIDVNLKGVFLCSQAVGREMISQKKGSIINVSSMCGIIAIRALPQVHHNASKAGVVMLTRSLAAEWAKYNVRVNAIAPGYMKTPMTERVIDKHENEWLSWIPMGRLGESHEMKGVAVFLASRASSYITGAVIVMDGGYTIL